MIKHALFYACLLLLLSSLQVQAQGTILDSYVNEALQQNLSIQATQLARQQQVNQSDQAKKLWGPKVDFNASYLFAEGGRTINFPTGDLFNPTYATLNQLTNSNQFPTDLENQNIQLTPNNFLDAQLNISLPLINSSIKYNQKIQQELLRLDDLNIQMQETDIAFQVKSAYFNYLKSLEGIRIIESSEGILQEVLSFNQKLVKFDKATDEIIFDVEYQIENLKSQKTALQEQSTIAQALFNLLLQRDLQTAILIDSSLLENIDLLLSPLDTYQKTALNNRFEFQQLEVAGVVNELNKTRIRKEAQPTLGLGGGIGLQTEAFDFNTGGPLFTIALSTSISLFDNGLRKKRVEELHIQDQILRNNRQQLEQKVAIEVLQVYFNLESLRSQMSSEAAAESSAQKSLGRFQTRYQNDKALLIELLQAENRLTQTQLSKLLTKYNFLLKKAELEKLLNES